MNLNSRLSKVARLIRGVVDDPEALFYLEIFGNLDKGLSLNKKEEALVLLNRLRVLVAFPKGLYEARPKKIGLTEGRTYLEFSLFYPADTGALPTRSDNDNALYEGFYLYLPPHPEKLNQIRAKFVLVDEQPAQENAAL